MLDFVDDLPVNVCNLPEEKKVEILLQSNFQLRASTKIIVK